MMDKSEYVEAYNISGKVVEIILSYATPGKDGAKLRMTIGKFISNFYESVKGGTVGTDLFDCFIAARDGGSSAVISMEEIRRFAIGESPNYLLGLSIVNASIIFAFSEQSKIIARTQFESREEVSRLMDGLSAAVEEVKIEKSNSFFVNDYRNYVELAAILFQHLSVTERQLPRIVKRRMATHLPTLNVSNRIYGDGSRSEELIAENKTIHPAFMQRDIVALSV